MERDKAIVRINADMPCYVLHFGKRIAQINTHDYTEIFLSKGKHRLSFVNLENEADKVLVEKEILDVDYEDIIDVELIPVRDSRITKEREERERIFALRREEDSRMRQEALRREEELRKRQEALRLEKEKEQKKLQSEILWRQRKAEAQRQTKFAEFPDLAFYDEIGNMFENYIIAWKSSCCGIIDKKSFMPVVPFLYTDICKCERNKDYFWVTDEKGKWGLLDARTNSFILEMKYEQIPNTY